MPRIQTFHVAPHIPEPLKALERIAYDLAWTWHPEAEALFTRIDAQRFEAVNGNPVALLGRVSPARIQALSQDQDFIAELQRVSEALDQDARQDRWFQRAQAAQHEGALVAYFCAEFGLSEALPIYSGGLGVLAGDHLKSASGIGLPLVGVGLAYQEGYFRQVLSVDGWQKEAPYDNDFRMLAMKRATFPDGTPASVDIWIEARRVRVRIWEVNIARTRLFLLDTNSPKNHPEDRNITYRLYGGDINYRCKQEIVLGIGGFYALQALGLTPSVYHMNEGHSAFMALARIADLRRRTTLSFAEAHEALCASNVFTTHTPVPAGFDIFSQAQLDRFLPRIHEELGLDRKAFYRLGAHDQDPTNERGFNMAYLALRCSGWVNGVSQLHGEVSRDMWKVMWPKAEVSEVPIVGITNGIHHQTWVNPEMAAFLDDKLGANWREDPAFSDAFAKVDNLPDRELWAIHERARHRLVDFVRQRTRRHAERLSLPRYEVDALSQVLDPNALTIGFARRFATYKRATLLLRDPERLRRILLNTERPIQFIFAGKAHPQDAPAKELIQELFHFARDPEIRKRLIFVEEYDMGVARKLIQGVDVWLNNPRRPKEASGTSGMKVLVNGGLNLSILDGWWAEGYDGENGWAIGRGENYADPDAGDAIEAAELLELLEHQVIPEFYTRDAQGLPSSWLARVKRSMRTMTSFFTTDRMVREYAERFYLPASKAGLAMAENDFAKARAQALEAATLQKSWTKAKFGEINVEAPYDLELGQSVDVSLDLYLGDISPAAILVEAYGGLVDGTRSIIAGESTVFSLDESASLDAGWYRYRGLWSPQEAGHNGMVIRARPRLACVAPARELPVMFWE